MAEATLVFDNSEGWLPTEFTEVAVTRRAFRSGENQYLINGRRVRLKDVAQLTASLGQSHVVVGQGLVGTAAGGDLRLPGGQLAAWWQQEGPARLWIVDTGTAQPVRAVTSETLSAVLGPAAWTPDGTGLTAEVALSDDDHDQVLAAADGSGEQPLVTGPGRQVGATISPDGTRLAYATNEGRKDYDILVRDLAGGEAVAITDFPGRDATPRWSIR